MRIQTPGNSATVAPMASEMPAARAVPVQAMRLACAPRPAPTFVPTMTTSAWPMAKTSGICRELQAHAHAVAGERRRAEAADEPGEDDGREHRLQRAHRGHRADAQDLAQHAGLDSPVRTLRPQTAAPDDRAHGEAREEEGRHVGERGAGDAQARQRPPAERERARKRNVHQRGQRERHRRRERIAAAAQHARQGVGEPHADRAGEQHVRVGERLRQRFAPAAEQCVERIAQAEEHGGEGEARACGDHQRVRDDALRRVLAAGAERARERRGHPAAHRARREHLQQHDHGKHEREPGERLGAELPYEVRVGDGDRGLEEGEQCPRGGKPRERGEDRAFEEALRAHGAHAASLT
jgi:hypothetical protein